ncbi:MAG: PAS domain-containing protein [Gaiellaceae bacterium]
METSPSSNRYYSSLGARSERSADVPIGATIEERRSRARSSHDFLTRPGAIVWEADPLDFRTIFVSHQAEEILGYPLQAWLDDASFLERRLDPARSEETMAQLRRAVDEGGDHVFPLRMVASDGNPVLLRVFLHSECDWQGRPRSLHGVMIDASSQRLESQPIVIQRSCLDTPSSETPVSPSSSRGGLPLSPRLEVPAEEGVDLNRLVRSLEPSLRLELGRAVILRLSLEADKAVVPIMPSSLERVLLCLARYARRSLLQGGELAIETSLEENADGSRSLLLSCADTGFGLDAVRRASVFATLFAGRSTEQEAQGLLRAVEEIIGNAGGSLSIHDEPFGGTRFEIVFPVS